MKITTAGESHGKALIAVIEGLPAGLKLDFKEIQEKLAMRQSGYGRGARQKIEQDTAEILTAVPSRLPCSTAITRTGGRTWRPRDATFPRAP